MTTTFTAIWRRVGRPSLPGRGPVAHRFDGRWRATCGRPDAVSGGACGGALGEVWHPPGTAPTTPWLLRAAHGYRREVGPDGLGRYLPLAPATRGRRPHPGTGSRVATGTAVDLPADRVTCPRCHRENRVTRPPEAGV